MKVLLSLFVFASLIQCGLLTAAETVRITTSQVTVRTGPDSAYAALGTVNGGEIYVATEESAGYHRIWFNRSEGWIHASHAEPTTSLYDDVHRGTNVRSGPSTSYSKVGYAKVGSKWAVATTSSSGNWHMIYYEGQACWFYASGRADTFEHVVAGDTLVTADEPVGITSPLAVVREGPGLHYDEIGTALQGQVYVSTESLAGWRKIWFSRESGWIAEFEMAVQSAEYDVVDWEWLNVRTGPGTEHEKITSVPAGSKFVSAAYIGSWHQIYFAGDLRWFSGVGVTTFDFSIDGVSPSPTSSSVGFVKLPASGPGFLRRCGANNPDHAWGDALLVNGFIAAAADWAATYPDRPRIRVGDLSLPGGGPFVESDQAYHVTHQHGTDVDLFLLRSDDSDLGAADVYDAAYSSERTREWITDFLAVHLPQVETHGILLSDPNIFGTITTVSSTAVCPGEGCALDENGAHLVPSSDGVPFVRCNPGHHDHMHVNID